MNELSYINNPKSLFRKYARLITSLTKHQAFRDYVMDETGLLMPQEPLALLLPNGFIKQLDKKTFELTTTTRAVYSPKLYPALKTIDYFNSHKWYSSFEEMQRALLHELTDLKLYKNPFGYRYEEARLRFLTLTAYPDPNPETTSVDGQVHRNAVDETFATIRAGAGTLANDTDASQEAPNLTGSTTTNQFQTLTRVILLFDTSALTSSATISAAVFSATYTGKASAIGETPVDIVSSNPASNTGLVAADYGTLGTTKYASKAYADITTAGAYNDYTLDANGIANVSKTGISKFGERLGWDTDNSFTGTWASAANTRVNTVFADTAGTASDPKLVVTYTVPATGGMLLMFA